jgi:hypothetical protein
MSLQGTAFLALWNDFDPARDDEYNCWHTFEHVPERVGVDGVLSGRRFIARERSERWRYFTLYELAGLDALSGPGYMDVVDHPSDWSLSMRPSFRNFFRQPCTTELSIGQGHGACVATYRVTLDARVESAQWARVLQPCIDSAALVAMHLGRVDTSAKFPLGNAAAEVAAGVPYVLLLEGTDRGQLERAIPQVLAAIGETLKPVAPVEGESYDLASMVEKRDLADRHAKRQPQRPDLRSRWSSPDN